MENSGLRAGACFWVCMFAAEGLLFELGFFGTGAAKKSISGSLGMLDVNLRLRGVQVSEAAEEPAATLMLRVAADGEGPLCPGCGGIGRYGCGIFQPGSRRPF